MTYRPTSIRRAILVAAMFLSCILARGARGADAAQILKEASAAISAQKTFTLGATIEYRGKFQGSEEQLDTTYSIALDRAGQIFVHVENADSDISLYRSDTEFTRYIPAFNQYVVGEPDMNAEEVVIASGFELIEPAIRAVATLAGPAPFTGAFVPEGLSYVGPEPQNGRPCDRIRFSAAGYTYDAWIEEGPGRLLRRIEPDMTPLEEKFGAQYGTVFDFTVAAVLDQWEAGADVSTLVRFTPPDGAEKVSQFMPPRPVTEAEKLTGAPAPDFTLPLLSGGEVTLSKERGATVILDFWATWCGPCRVAMPALHQIAKEFAGRGVKLYSIDEGEDAETVRSFLAQVGLEDIPVLLDLDAAVGEIYKADGIPQTVIVGTDGVVRLVHVGLWAMPTGEPADTPEGQEKQMNEALVESMRNDLNKILDAAPVSKP